MTIKGKRSVTIQNTKIRENRIFENTLGLQFRSLKSRLQKQRELVVEPCLKYRSGLAMVADVLRNNAVL